MKEYSSESPEFSSGINIVETTDLVNAENNNAAPKQLLQNDLVLHALIEALTQQLENNTKAAKDYTDVNYQQSTAYTDQKIAALINGAPSTLDTLKEIADAMTENETVVKALEAAMGLKASQAEMESLLGLKLDKTGDSGDTTVDFTSSDTLTPSTWSDFSLLTGREKLKEFARKVSTMAKNLRWLYKTLGTTDISDLGDGTVTGALNVLNSNLSGFKFGILTNDNLDDPPKGCALATGLIDNLGYISIITGWVILQIRVNYKTASKRIKYGANSWTEWVDF